MSHSWEHLEFQFERLMSIPADERDEHLARLSARDPSLGRQLAELIQSADQTVEFSAEAASNELLSASQIGPDSVLKGYRLLRLLGQGGMGMVYLAQRETDYEQQVAIKLGRHILDPGASIRFQRERQILAQLNHPYICQLLDGGTTRSQTPFLVMEYIQGESIDAYCRHRKCGLLEVLRLYRCIGEAVSHAHQHLIIHRDIKPSNILVQGDGTPRLLDFGIAKIIDEKSASSHTQTQAMTPPYVSPEQLLGKATSTLTDVYALGLLLHELLLGQRAQDVSAQNLSEWHQIVIERPPAQLMQVLSPSRPATTQAGRDLQQTHSAWQRDLQNILARALAKEPARRYPSVSALIADLDRLQAGNPVDASGDSLGYRLGKMVRRYRVQFAALAIAVGSLIVLAVGLTALTLIANDARDDAQRRLTQSESLIHYLLTDLRAQLEPTVSLQILDSVGEQATAYFVSLEPEDQTDDMLAQMALSLRQIGDIRLSQGRFNEGQAAFRRSMELTQSLQRRDPDHDQRLFDLGQSHFWVGYAAHQLGDLPSARASFQRYLEISEQLVTRQPNRLDWLLELSYARNNLGTLDQQSGQLQSARTHFRASLKLKQQLTAAEPDNLLWQTETADTMAWLADAEEALGDLEAAADHQHQRWQTMSRLATADPANRNIQRSLGYAALALARQQQSLGRIEQVETLLLQAISLADQRVAHDPLNLKWPEDAARARLDLARHLILMHQLTQARARLDEAQALTAQLRSGSESKPAWEIELWARSEFLDLLWLLQEAGPEVAVQHLPDWFTRLQRLSDQYPSNRFLSRLQQLSWLLGGSVNAALCRTDIAQSLWQRVLNQEQAAAHRHPEDLATTAIAMTRLGQTGRAEAIIDTLSSMGYAEPAYIRDIQAAARGPDCESIDPIAGNN